MNRQGDGKKKLQKKKQIMRRCRGGRGVITVLVTLLMVPVVTVTSLLVDAARLKLYSSQAVMAADSYGEAVLSEYSNVLKELYGLFAVTQNEEGLEAVKKMEEYMTYSFLPGADGKTSGGYMPYKGADVKLEYEYVPGSSLGNENVLMTQISDFMRFRVVQELLEGTGILGGLEELRKCEKDMEAVEARSDITRDGMDALKKIKEYYQNLDILAKYPDYIENCKRDYDAYSSLLGGIVDSGGYADFCNYRNHKAEIDSARAGLGGAAAECDRIRGELNAAATAQEKAALQAELDDAEDEYDRLEELADQYVDEDAYLAGIRGGIEAAERAAKGHWTDSPINFDTVAGPVNRLGELAGPIESTLGELKRKVENLRGKLEGCSDAVKEGIKDEIKDLEKLTDQASKFKNTYELIAVTYDDKAKNQQNKERLQNLLPELDAAAESILDGSRAPGTKGWTQVFSYEWGDFQDNAAARKFYEVLKAQFKPSGAEADKSAGDKEIKQAEEFQKEAAKELEKEEPVTARDISNALAGELGIGDTAPSGEGLPAAGEKLPSLTGVFTGDLSLAGAGTQILDSFLVMSYDFGMFSSRVSGIEPPGEEDEAGLPDGAADGSGAGAEGADYADYSLTKAKMSPSVNYLYGAELEYLFGGHLKSKDNLNEVRNLICLVRMSMNFISSYRITEVNTVINNIANLAMEAAAATVVGAPFAPLVRVAVSGALRLAFATAETAGDWKMLKERKSVVFVKENLSELTSVKAALEGLFGCSLTESGSKKNTSLKFSYEQYLFLMMLFKGGSLMERTSDLITLNVNQAARKPEEKNGELPVPLKFKMQDAYTAVKSTCKVKADFAVLPESFAELYLKGTETGSQVELLEKHYFGYSVIRGY